MAPMGPGTYGSQKGRPKKKKRPSKLMGGSFPTPPKPKAPKARTDSSPMKPKPAPVAGSMRAATMALLKKKKKK